MCPGLCSCCATSSYALGTCASVMLIADILRIIGAVCVEMVDLVVYDMLAATSPQNASRVTQHHTPQLATRSPTSHPTHPHTSHLTPHTPTTLTGHQ